MPSRPVRMCPYCFKRLCKCIWDREELGWLPKPPEAPANAQINQGENGQGIYSPASNEAVERPEGP